MPKSNAHVSITVTLDRIEWTHITVALSHIAHDKVVSHLVKNEYGKIVKRIRDQVESQLQQEESK